MTHRLRIIVLGAAAAVCLGLMGTAQCLRWDPGVGNQLGADVRTFAVFDDGGGTRLYSGGSHAVGKWTGQSWLFDGDFDSAVEALTVYDDGSGAALYATGDFQIAGTMTARSVAKRIGPGNWVEVGNGLPSSQGPGAQPRSLAVYDDGTGPCLYVGGVFTTYSSIASPSLVKWNGTAWSGVGGGVVYGSTPGGVLAMCLHDDGAGIALYVGGGFTAAGGVPANSIARWDGSTWMPLGSGLQLNGSFGNVQKMVEYDDGSGPALFVCGTFDHAGGVPASSIAKWSHGVWSALPGSPPGTQFFSMSVFDDGDGSALYVGRSGPVMKWKGGSWWALGQGPIGQFNAMYAFDDGQGGGEALYVGGNIGFNGSIDIVRWRGCKHDVDSMCFGDGTFTFCPCNNYGSFGHGCRNSGSTAGAELTFTGGTHPDTLFLTSANELPTSLSLFIQSASLNSTPILFGDGIRCLSGHIQRMYVKHAAAGTVHAPEGGDLPITTRSAQLGDPIAPGSVRYYQVWYRDGSPNYCSLSTFNISNGLRAVW